MLNLFGSERDMLKTSVQLLIYLLFILSLSVAALLSLDLYSWVHMFVILYPFDILFLF